MYTIVQWGMGRQIAIMKGDICLSYFRFYGSLHQEESLPLATSHEAASLQLTEPTSTRTDSILPIRLTSLSI
jgi:hypothetical protein